MWELRQHGPAIGNAGEALLSRVNPQYTVVSVHDTEWQAWWRGAWLTICHFPTWYSVGRHFPDTPVSAQLLLS